jgi:hypothetical protein
LESLQNLKTDLIKYDGQQWDVAGRVTASDATAHFKSKSYENYKKGKENELKAMYAINENLGTLIKIMSKRG